MLFLYIYIFAGSFLSFLHMGICYQVFLIICEQIYLIHR